MGNFFKTFGRGLLVVIFSPLIAAFIVLNIAYQLINFIVMSIFSIVLFFTGKSLKNEEDDETKILVAMNTSGEVNRVEKALFDIPDYINDTKAEIPASLPPTLDLSEVNKHE